LVTNNRIFCSSLTLCLKLGVYLDVCQESMNKILIIPVWCCSLHLFFNHWFNLHMCILSRIDMLEIIEWGFETKSNTLHGFVPTTKYYKISNWHLVEYNWIHQSDYNWIHIEFKFIQFNSQIQCKCPFNSHLFNSIKSPFNANLVQFQFQLKSNIFTIFHCLIGLQINHCSNKRNLNFFSSTLTISSSLKVGSLSPNPQRLFKSATTFGGLGSSVSQSLH
jgi:hypothetical protein